MSDPEEYAYHIVPNTRPLFLIGCWHPKEGVVALQDPQLVIAWKIETTRDSGDHFGYGIPIGVDSFFFTPEDRFAIYDMETEIWCCPEGGWGKGLKSLLENFQEHEDWLAKQKAKKVASVKDL